jgi:hypothetical protein
MGDVEAAEENREKRKREQARRCGGVRAFFFGGSREGRDGETERRRDGETVRR